MKVELTGTLVSVHKPRTTPRGSIWPFVLMVSVNNNEQQYLISAFSDSKSQDAFGLMDFENRKVAVKCYLNGRRYLTQPEEVRFSNELKLISIKAA